MIEHENPKGLTREEPENIQECDSASCYFCIFSKWYTKSNCFISVRMPLGKDKCKQRQIFEELEWNKPQL